MAANLFLTFVILALFMFSFCYIIDKGNKWFEEYSEDSKAFFVIWIAIALFATIFGILDVWCGS